MTSNQRRKRPAAARIANSVRHDQTAESVPAAVPAPALLKQEEHRNIANKGNNQPQPSPVPSSQHSKMASVQQKCGGAQCKKFVAIDCEMVGVGTYGRSDMLARVSIVNKEGEVLLDKFVKPRQPVTDYRTRVSGIRPRDIEQGEDFSSVQHEVIELLRGNILVGHSLGKDLSVLGIEHPHKDIRDTATYVPLSQVVSYGRTPSLKSLSKVILGHEIQAGEHDSVEDARTAMRIYNLLSRDWEIYLRGKYVKPGGVNIKNIGGRRQ